MLTCDWLVACIVLAGTASIMSFIGFAFGEASTPLQNIW
jgi:hypothetical protein